MSISFPTGDSKSTLETIREQRAGTTRATTPRATSSARIEANRRNCRKSTGPRTIEGKRRASRNAMKHGLCRTLSCLPSECEATFLTFVAELETELRPATAMQCLAFNQIASLTWRLERLPEAQTKLFGQELAKVESDDDSEESLSPSDVLARRFSDAPGNNGFALMERYERGMRNQLLRLLRQFDQLKKQRATTPYDEDEPPCPPERAWRAIDEEEKQRRVQETRERESKPQPPDWSELRQEHLRRETEAEVEAAEGSQSKPTEIGEKPSPERGDGVLPQGETSVGDGTKPMAGVVDEGGCVGLVGMEGGVGARSNPAAEAASPKGVGGGTARGRTPWGLISVRGQR